MNQRIERKWRTKGPITSFFAFLIVLTCWALVPCDLSARQEVSKFDSLLSRWKSRIGADSSQVLPYFRLAETYRYADKLQEGQRFFETALGRDPKRRSLLAGRALIAKYQSDWPDCFEFGRRALLSGSESPAVLDLTVECGVEAEKSSALAATLRKLKRYKSQKSLFDLGYAMWRLRIKHLRKARTSIEAYLSSGRKDAFGYEVLGQILLAMEDNASAVKAFKTAEQLTHNPSLNRMDIWAGLSGGYRQIGRSDSSLYYIKLARRSAEDTGVLNKVVSFRQREKDVYFDLALPGKVSEVCLKGIAAAMVLHDSSALGQFYLALGRARAALSDHTMALAYLKKALNVAQASGRNVLRATTTLELGRDLVALNRLDSAARYFTTGYEQALRDGLPEIAHQLLLASADLERDGGHRKAANDKYRTVLKFSQRKQLHTLTEKCFLRLSHLYLLPPQDREGASYFLNLADALTRQTSQLQFAANHRWMQGNIAWSEGQVEAAETRFLQAMQLGAESGSQTACLAGQAGLVRTYLNAGFAEMAATQADSGLRYLNKYYRLDQKEEASPYFDLKNDFFTPAISAFAKAGDLNKIYQAGEQYSAMRHYFNIAPARHQIDSAKIDSLNLMLQVVRKFVLNKKKSLRHLWENRVDNPERVEQIQRDIEELYLKQGKLLAAAERSEPAAASVMTWKTRGLPDLQTKLAVLKATYVQYFVGDKSTFVTVVSSNDMFCKRLNVTSTHLEQLVTQIAPALTKPHAEKSAENDLQPTNFRLDKAAQLYQIIFEPIRDLLGADTELIISPSGVLNRIPFEILVLNPGDLIDNYDYKHARFLVEAFPTSYVPTAATLQTPRTQFLPRANILLLNSHESRSSNVSLDSSTILQPRAMNEEFVQKITSALDVTVLPASELRKKAFGERAKAYEFLHLSVPGNYNDAEALYTTLCFGDDPKNMMQVKDLFNMHLNGRLAIVDRLTRNPSNDSEQNGSGAILHAFTYAGIPSLILSLWDQAPDVRTAIETNLYTNLSNGLSKARSLQQAKVAFLNQGNRDPGNWASLMLYGDPRPILVGSSHTDRIVYSIAVAVLALIGVLVARIARQRRNKVA